MPSAVATADAAALADVATASAHSRGHRRNSNNNNNNLLLFSPLCPTLVRQLAGLWLRQLLFSANIDYRQTTDEERKQLARIGIPTY